MTLKELSQLYYLKLEIEKDRQRLAEMRYKAESPASGRITGMPKSTTTENRIERHVADIADLSAVIENRLQKCIQEQARLELFIAGIPDSLTRLIFTLRFVDGLDWEATAGRISYHYSGKYASNLVYKYLRKINTPAGGEKHG